MSTNRKKSKRQPKRSEWTPEEVANLIKLVDTLAQKYVTFKRDEAQADVKILESTIRHNRLLTGILSVFLVVIVGLMSYLAAVNIVSGDALLFLVGTITGYIIGMIQSLVLTTPPSRRPAPEQ